MGGAIRLTLIRDRSVQLGHPVHLLAKGGGNCPSLHRKTCISYDGGVGLGVGLAISRKEDWCRSIGVLSVWVAVGFGAYGVCGGKIQS